MVFGANTPYHAVTLTSDPLTLNYCGRSGIINIPNMSETGKSPAELLIINDRFMLYVRFQGVLQYRNFLF